MHYIHLFHTLMKHVFLKCVQCAFKSVRVHTRLQKYTCLLCLPVLRKAPVKDALVEKATRPHRTALPGCHGNPRAPPPPRSPHRGCQTAEARPKPRAPPAAASVRFGAALSGGLRRPSRGFQSSSVSAEAAAAIPGWGSGTIQSHPPKW